MPTVFQYFLCGKLFWLESVWALRLWHTEIRIYSYMCLWYKISAKKETIFDVTEKGYSNSREYKGHATQIFKL